MGKKRDQLSALLRSEFRFFIRQTFRTVSPGADYLHNWHIDLIAEYCEAVIKGDITRLVVNMPPRYAKSICFSIALPAFILGLDPSEQCMCASYSQDLALKFSVDTRLVTQMPWYQQAFPDFQMTPDQNQKGYFKTTKQGHRFSTSVGTSRIGFGGNYLIVDDPVDPEKAMSKVTREKANRWFEQSFYTRLNDKKAGRIIVVMQRLHDKDLSGHLLDKGGYEHLKIQGISEKKIVIALGKIKVERDAGDILHPEREDKPELDSMKLTLGTQGFSAQYQQEPVAADGNIFVLSWFRRYKNPPLEFIRVIQSWDTAYTEEERNDPSVCVTMGETINSIYILDVYRGHLKFPQLKQKVMSLAAKWSPTAILVEGKASGKSIIQQIQHESTLPMLEVEPTDDKIVRASAVSPTIEAGVCQLPEKAQWLHDYEDELEKFPNSEHDDQVDATSQGITYLTMKVSKPRIEIL